MPRAIAGGVCFVIVLYLLVNVSYLAVLGPSGVLQSVAVAVVSNPDIEGQTYITYLH